LQSEAWGSHYPGLGFLSCSKPMRLHYVEVGHDRQHSQFTFRNNPLVSFDAKEPLQSIQSR